VTKAQPGTELGPSMMPLTVGKRAVARAEFAGQRPASPASAASGPLDAAQNDRADAAPGATCAGRAGWLQKFVDLVKAVGITLGLMKYAQDSWPVTATGVVRRDVLALAYRTGFPEVELPRAIQLSESGDYAR
jgi:hypothetical protein